MRVPYGSTSTANGSSDIGPVRKPLMINIVLAVGLWYGLGASAAAWAAHKGHSPDVWIIGAAMWGAIMVPLLIVARLTVLARPAQPQLPLRHERGAGLHALLILHVDDSPKEALARLTEMTLPVSTLDVVVLVSEEASSGMIASPEIPAANQSLHRILRAIPPVETSTAVTSLSGIQQLARRGWRADIVIAAPLVHDRWLGKSAARAAGRLGHLSQDSLDLTDPPRTTTRTQPSLESFIPERVDAA